MTAALDPYVTAASRAGQGYRPDPAYVDYLSAFAEHPMLVAMARDEVVRLSMRGGPRVLSEHDHLSKVRHDTLVKMLAAFDAKGVTA